MQYKGIIFTFLCISLTLFYSCNDNHVPIPPYEEDDNVPTDTIGPVVEGYKLRIPEDFVEDTIIKQKLIGEWKLIFIGADEFNSKRGMPTNTTTEFLPNGMRRDYSVYPDKYSERYLYKISSDYYWVSLPEEELENLGGGIWKYKYSFYDDKFEIEVVAGLILLEETKYIYQKMP